MAPSLLHIIGLLVFVYLLINIGYLLVVSIAGKLRRPPLYDEHSSHRRIAVLIPAYMEDEVIIETALQASGHNYPKEYFEIFVAAHHLQTATVQRLKQIPVQVEEVKFEIGSKARSLNKLLNSIPEGQFDIALILDEDNIMMPGCLEKINAAFARGFNAVQCHRIAKNSNTPVAVLDALSEEINNHLFRQGQRAMGFSAAITGSGMAFAFDKLKEVYNRPEILSNPACDREVDFEMMKAHIPVEFIPDAFVLDEKVSSKAVFEQQRTRWLESQIRHLQLFARRSDRHIRRSSEYWNKLFLNLMPPRIFFLFAFFLILLLYLAGEISKHHFLFPAPLYWALLLLALLMAFLLAVPAQFFKNRKLSALLYIPVLGLSMLKALFRIRPGRKEFLHTPKTFREKNNT